MIRRIFFQWSQELEEYWVLEQGQNVNFDLDYLWQSFSHSNEWIFVDEDEDGWVVIWCNWNLKGIDTLSKNQLELPAYHKAYQAYSKKRWDDMPVLEITKQNYEEVKEQWAKLNERKESEYVVFELDEMGCVRIIPKNYLTQDDIDLLAEDKKRYDSFREKYDFYMEGKQDNKSWLSSEDDEFYSDFLTEEEMVWKKKKF